MKILIDLTSLADNFSGIERYAACLSHEMIKNSDNYYVLLFKNAIHPMFLEYREKNNVECVVIAGRRKLFFNQIILPLEIYKHKADWYLFLAFPVPIFLFKKNMISTIHDVCCWDCPETMNELSKWYFRISHRVAIHKCTRIMTISKFSEDRIVDKLKYSREKIWRIYCGTDEKFMNYKKNIEKDMQIRDKYHLPNGYLLSLSTLEPRKNLRLLIEVYRELVLESDFHIPLVLAGRKGWKIDQLLNGIEDSVRSQIIFTGFIDDDDLPAVYGNADLFVFPSLYEGFGMPPLEAMSVGTRVVSSGATSLPEVLGDAAIYFQNQDKEDLKRVIVYALQLDELKKNAQIENGKENGKKFQWSFFAEELLDLMKKNNKQLR